MRARDEQQIELEKVGKSVKIRVKTMDNNKRGMFKTNPNMIVKMVGATFQDDPSSPNAELLKIALKADRDALVALGVPIEEVPPAKQRLGFQPTLGEQEDVDEMRRALREALKFLKEAEEEPGAAKYIHGKASDQLKVAARFASSSRSVSSRIKETQKYVDYESNGKPSKYSRGYAMNMINDLLNTTYYVERPVQDDLKDDYKDDFYDDIKDGGHGDYKDGHGNGDIKGGGYHQDGDIKGGAIGGDMKGGHGNGDIKGGHNSGDIKTNTSFRTGLGTRKYDRVKANVAIDEKNGRVGMSESIEAQIQKDLEVMDTFNGINFVEWHFYPRGGKVGPTESVRRKLVAADIRIVIHNSSHGSDLKGGHSSDYKSGSSSDIKGGGGFYDSDLK